MKDQSEIFKGLSIFWHIKSPRRNVFLYCFYLGFKDQDYFTHFEPSQSVDGTKTGDPREQPPDHPQAEVSLFHM